MFLVEFARFFDWYLDVKHFFSSYYTFIIVEHVVTCSWMSSLEFFNSFLCVLFTIATLHFRLPS